MSILEDFQRGTGMFGITALSNERKLASRIGPAVASAYGHMASTGIAGANDITKANINAGAQERIATQRDIGDTLRLNLVNAANKDITGMQQTGMTGRTAMEQAGQTFRNEVTTGRAYDLGSRGLNLQQYLGKESLIEGARQFNAGTDTLRNKRDGGVSPQQALQTTEGALEEETPALPAGITAQDLEAIRKKKLQAASPSVYFGDEDYAGGSW